MHPFLGPLGATHSVSGAFGESCRPLNCSYKAFLFWGTCRSLWVPRVTLGAHRKQCRQLQFILNVVPLWAQDSFILLNDKLGVTERLASRVLIKFPLVTKNAMTINNCISRYWHCKIGLLEKCPQYT